MKKNSQVHLFLETELVEKLKELARANKISFSELCRRKLREIPQMKRIENLLEDIHKKLINNE